jgi:hypothetical protein
MARDLKSATSKLSGLTARSPVPALLAEEPPTAPLGLLTKGRKQRSVSKTYRFKDTDLERLRAIEKVVEEGTGEVLTDTDILRALLVLGCQAKPEKLLDALDEANRRRRS